LLTALGEGRPPRGAEAERDLLRLTQIGEPVPAEPALAGDGQAIAEGRSRLEKGGRLRRQVLMEDDGTGRIDKADVQTYMDLACKSTPQ
jgi:hypothetical protein